MVPPPHLVHLVASFSALASRRCPALPTTNAAQTRRAQQDPGHVGGGAAGSADISKQAASEASRDHQLGERLCFGAVMIWGAVMF